MANPSQTVNVTTVTFPREREELLNGAIDYYRLESKAAFFRKCGEILIDHFKRGDGLSMPLMFESFVGNGRRKVGRGKPMDT